MRGASRRIAINNSMPITFSASISDRTKSQRPFFSTPIVTVFSSCRGGGWHRCSLCYHRTNDAFNPAIIPDGFLLLVYSWSTTVDAIDRLIDEMRRGCGTRVKWKWHRMASSLQPVIRPGRHHGHQAAYISHQPVSLLFNPPLHSWWTRPQDQAGRM